MCIIIDTEYFDLELLGYWDETEQIFCLVDIIYSKYELLFVRMVSKTYKHKQIRSKAVYIPMVPICQHFICKQKDGSITICCPMI